MRMLGIDWIANSVAEGENFAGSPLHPAPVLVPAQIQSANDEQLTGAPNADAMGIELIFREDSFDPVSRVRRGRFYEKCQGNPHRWHIKESPWAIYSNQQLGPKELITFQAGRISQQLNFSGVNQSLILLGVHPQFTIWTVNSIESDVMREEIFTLRSRVTIGALPLLLSDSLPSSSADQIRSKHNALSEEIFRAGPESVVDRCRELATAALSAYLQASYGVRPGKDLADALEELERQITKEKGTIREVEMVLSAGRILRQLHSRGKNAEQERRPIRTVVEQDAQLAIASVGALLCDLGYARWL